MNLPTHVRIVEVGPRDGLQNESAPFSTEHRIELVHALMRAGLKHIEAGSFVNPKVVPQMADSGEVFRQLRRDANVTLSSLTPNVGSLERAIAAGVDEVAVFTAASETFNQRNINCSIAESMARIQPVIEQAKIADLPVRGYVSCVAGCPYEGDISTAKVQALTSELLELGCYEVSLGDTIGVGTAGQISNLIEDVIKVADVERIAVHFHDTYGQALANIYAALQLGVSVVDSSVAGLGGCPFADGATGNVATEDVVYLLNGLGIQTGVDVDRLLDAGNYISRVLERPNASRAATALTRKRER